MRNISRIILILLCSAIAWAEPTVLDLKDLRKQFESMGHKITDISDTKFSFPMSRDSLDITVGVEVSPSKNYVWYTINLGAFKESADKTKAHQLLVLNGKIQPNQCYLSSKDLVMLGHAMENRDLTLAMLNTRLENMLKWVPEAYKISQLP